MSTEWAYKYPIEQYKMDYFEPMFLREINKNEVNTIVEVGAFGGLSTILLYRYYSKPIFVFECNEYFFEELLKNIAPYPEITFIPYGAWNETKKITFYNSHFIGTPSFYEFDEELLTASEELTARDLMEQQELRKDPLVANVVRLDEWMEQQSIKQIDLLCVGAHGAALNTLKGLGNRINDVKYIIAEVKYNPVPDGPTLFYDVEDFMSKKGFECFYEDGYIFGYALFVNKR